MHTEDGEPDGIAAGLTSSALHNGKHFQRGSATVLCGTVNPKANPKARGLHPNVPTPPILNAPRQDFGLWPIDMPPRR